MKKIAFLSCDDLDGHVVDDHVLVQELSPHYDISTISWTAKANWHDYDAVIIRTTWDYVPRHQEFLKVLEEIQLSGTKLFNPYSVVNWNIHKFYLKELEEKGVSIVPTLFINENSKVKLPAEWKQEKFILKPAISATAYKTTVLSRKDIENESYKSLMTSGDWLLQPFIENITKGEISLVYFDKKFSHGIKKVPKPGDFRVQEEFGGDIKTFHPQTEHLAFGYDVIDKVDFPLLYARVDMVPYQNGFVLMELELIEPSLYFRTTDKGASNFALAMKNYL